MNLVASSLLAMSIVAWNCGIASANCGPGGIFQDNDYCISCGGGGPHLQIFKENSCPGGDVGLATEGTLHPGCSVSYYDPASCHVTSHLNRSLIELLKKERHLGVTFANPEERHSFNAKASGGQH